jgi:diguanylate cyclase (GGDEF)-like protein
MKSSFFGSLLDVIPFATYAVDIENYQVVYINKILNDRIYAPEEKLCWKKIYGQTEICSWCMVFKLMEENKLEKNKKIVNTFFDESSDTWLQAYDELITWTDGRIVKCTIAIDITEQKEMQASLIQTHTKLAIQTNKLKETNDKYELLSKTDYLTGINNRRNFFYLGETLYKNDNKNTFVAIFDLDKFKELNDTFGHHLGDKALISFAKKVEIHINKELDIFGRLGGEEFALIITSSCEKDIYLKIDNIRKAIEEITLVEEMKVIHFTVSIGLVKREIDETLDMTLEKEDKLLYEAKNSGRNQVKFRI